MVDPSVRVLGALVLSVSWVLSCVCCWHIYRRLFVQYWAEKRALNDGSVTVSARVASSSRQSNRDTAAKGAASSDVSMNSSATAVGTTLIPSGTNSSNDPSQVSTLLSSHRSGTIQTTTSTTGSSSTMIKDVGGSSRMLPNPNSNSAPTLDSSGKQLSEYSTTSVTPKQLGTSFSPSSRQRFRSSTTAPPDSSLVTAVSNSSHSDLVYYSNSPKRQMSVEHVSSVVNNNAGSSANTAAASASSSHSNQIMNWTTRSSDLDIRYERCMRIYYAQRSRVALLGTAAAVILYNTVQRTLGVLTFYMRLPRLRDETFEGVLFTISSFYHSVLGTLLLIRAWRMFVHFKYYVEIRTSGWVGLLNPKQHGLGSGQSGNNGEPSVSSEGSSTARMEFGLHPVPVRPVYSQPTLTALMNPSNSVHRNQPLMTTQGSMTANLNPSPKQGGMMTKSGSPGGSRVKRKQQRKKKKEMASILSNPMIHGSALSPKGILTQSNTVANDAAGDSGNETPKADERPMSTTSLTTAAETAAEDEETMPPAQLSDSSGNEQPPAQPVTVQPQFEFVLTSSDLEAGPQQSAQASSDDASVATHTEGQALGTVLSTLPRGVVATVATASSGDDFVGEAELVHPTPEDGDQKYHDDDEDEQGDKKDDDGSGAVSIVGPSSSSLSSSMKNAQSDDDESTTVIVRVQQFMNDVRCCDIISVWTERVNHGTCKVCCTACCCCCCSYCDPKWNRHRRRLISYSFWIKYKNVLTSEKGIAWTCAGIALVTAAVLLAIYPLSFTAVRIFLGANMLLFPLLTLSVLYNVPESDTFEKLELQMSAVLMIAALLLFIINSSTLGNLDRKAFRFLNQNLAMFSYFAVFALEFYVVPEWLVWSRVKSGQLELSDHRRDISAILWNDEKRKRYLSGNLTAKMSRDEMLSALSNVEIFTEFMLHCCEEYCSENLVALLEFREYKQRLRKHIFKSDTNSHHSRLFPNSSNSSADRNPVSNNQADSDHSSITGAAGVEIRSLRPPKGGISTPSAGAASDAGAFEESVGTVTHTRAFESSVQSTKPIPLVVSGSLKPIDPIIDDDPLAVGSSALFELDNHDSNQPLENVVAEPATPVASGPNAEDELEDADGREDDAEQHQADVDDEPIPVEITKLGGHTSDVVVVAEQSIVLEKIHSTKSSVPLSRTDANNLNTKGTPSMLARRDEVFPQKPPLLNPARSGSFYNSVAYHDELYKDVLENRKSNTGPLPSRDLADWDIQWKLSLKKLGTKSAIVRDNNLSWAEKAQRLFSKYIAIDSPLQLVISHRVREDLRWLIGDYSTVKHNLSLVQLLFIFDMVIPDIIENLLDSFRRFSQNRSSSSATSPKAFAASL